MWRSCDAQLKHRATQALAKPFNLQRERGSPTSARNSTSKARLGHGGRRQHPLQPHRRLVVPVGIRFEVVHVVHAGSEPVLWDHELGRRQRNHPRDRRAEVSLRTLRVGLQLPHERVILRLGGCLGRCSRNGAPSPRLRWERRPQAAATRARRRQPPDVDVRGILDHLETMERAEMFARSWRVPPSFPVVVDLSFALVLPNALRGVSLDVTRDARQIRPTITPTFRGARHGERHGALKPIARS
mmetsp:Transcript_119672/g.338806  ORF Transcript_119672/g.338806 Transcript_119672/m.338806 type:complete len:243 (+) Transcript_119672:57-785(+)|eukprot:CAMPEP_0117524962 /NCGR_PEP_ID=MMETSP0784-20121206/35520_1 /TAXON_ID=39447 /ORGANISM="" /LENGTH=242 /DNA_ID=CAMNT_0005321135 /DNA_START=38 /DNA_END=766 /DNA_ORIENTATION=-